jgi:hypothetical protein
VDRTAVTAEQDGPGELRHVHWCPACQQESVCFVMRCLDRTQREERCWACRVAGRS